jgi:hypothetical protein
MKQPFVLNVHMFPDMDIKTPEQLARNTKAAWQSSNTPDGTQKNICATMEKIGQWIEDGIIEDGDIIELTGQVTFTTNTPAPMAQSSIKVTRNGKTVATDLPSRASAKAAAAETPEVPF